MHACALRFQFISFMVKLSETTAGSIGLSFILSIIITK